MIDLSQSIATIINFVIFLIILKIFLFKPVQNILANRENYIEEKIKNAKVNEEKAKDLSIQRESELQQSKEQGKALIKDYKYRAERVSENIIKEAHNEAELILKRARTEIELEREKAEDEIKNKIVDLSVLMCTKALEEIIDEDKQRKLIKDFISKVGI